MHSEPTLVLRALAFAVALTACGPADLADLGDFEPAVGDLSTIPSAAMATRATIDGRRRQLLPNGDFEQGRSAWGGGVNGGLHGLSAFTAPWEPYSGKQMARAQARGAHGSLWSWVGAVDVAGHVDVRGSVAIRSNLTNLRVFIYQRNRRGEIIASSSTAPFTPKTWRWDVVGFKANLVAGCYDVFLAVVGNAYSNRTHYLDLDAAKLHSNRARFGVHSALGYSAAGDAGYAGHVQRLHDLGVRISRTTAPWALIEKSQGTYDWGSMDAALEALEARGIAPLIVLNTSPAWANGSNDRQYIPPGDTQAFWQWRWHSGQFVEALARRYKGRIKYWEIGNEVNIDDFWRPKPDIWQYCTWADYIYDRIKAVDPGAQIALAGLAVLNHAWTEKQISGTDFIRGMRKWKGGKLIPKMRNLGIHPYGFDHADAPTAPPGAAGRNRFRDVETIHAVSPDSRLWLTEFGWQIGRSRGDAVMTKALQADYLRQAVGIIGRWPYVEMAIWFWDWDRNRAFVGYGLIANDGKARPAATTYRQLVGR
jgi:hypothetical protein